MERWSKIMPENVPSMLLTELVTSHLDVKVGLLYSCLNEIVTFCAIQVEGYVQLSPNLVHICRLIRHIGLQMLWVNGQITRSRNKKVGQIVITLSIFELELRTKAQNVGDNMTYIGIILNFQYKFRFKRSPEPQNGGHFENFEIF